MIKITILSRVALVNLTRMTQQHVIKYNLKRAFNVSTDVISQQNLLMNFSFHA